MAISIILPDALSPYAKGSGTLVLDSSCNTVGDALAAVAARWPAVTDRVLTEQGEVRQHVNVFVGEENIRFMSGLETSVGGDTTITIVAAISGG